jgi:hypothetical protein
MTENGRLKSILEKQNAADRADVAEATRKAAADSHAKELRSRVVNEWWRLCGVLSQTVATANDAMTGGRKLYLQHYNPHAERTVAGVIIMFEDKYSEEVRRKCVVGVDLDGTVSVSIKPQSKDYHVNIWNAAVEQIEGIVYDFMELNIIETPLTTTPRSEYLIGLSKPGTPPCSR